MISIALLSILVSLLLKDGGVHLADSNVSKGFCNFPTFLWATESTLGDFGDSNHPHLNRKWTTETEYRSSGDGWIRSTRLIAWSSKVTVKKEIDGYCGTGSYRVVEDFEARGMARVRKRSPEKVDDVNKKVFLTRSGGEIGLNNYRHHHHRRQQKIDKRRHKEHAQTLHKTVSPNTSAYKDSCNVSGVLSNRRDRRRNRGLAKPPCFEREPAYDIICLSEETNNKYRIRYRNQFSCVKFESIQENVIRVWKAPLNRVNEGLLCNDDSLARQPWPWISYEKQRHVNCPSLGGFDFRASTAEGKGVCGGEWLPSRMEMGCMDGEDLLFIFQKNKCSLFPRPDQEHRFKCWAHWTEDDHLFIVFGEGRKEARYIMRLPTNASALTHLSGQLYTSPVAPLCTMQDQDSSKGYVFQLQLNRSESGMCYDENALSCKSLSRTGHCRSSLENSSHCQKSCHLCDPLKPLRHECRFPVETRGTWLSITEAGRIDEVHIDEGRLAISGLGEFICKNRHPRSNEYKLVVAFSNGCRPKYSCIELLRTENDLLSLRMSRFSKWDLPFESFYGNVNTGSGEDDDDDDSLVMNQSFKQLKMAGDARESTCDFRLSAEAEVTFSNTSRCLGSLSDLDPVTCQTRSNMAVNMTQCSVRNQIEFKCLSSFNLLNNERLLVTRSHTNRLGFQKRNICWKVKVASANKDLETETETMRGKNRQKSKNLKIFIHRVKCRTWEHVFMTSYPGDVISIKLTKDITPQSCPSYRQPKHQSVANKLPNRNKPFKSSTIHRLEQNEVSQSLDMEPLIGYNDHHYSNHQVLESEHKRTIQVYKNGFITVAEDFFTNPKNMASVSIVTIIRAHWLICITADFILF